MIIVGKQINDKYALYDSLEKCFVGVNLTDKQAVEKIIAHDVSAGCSERYTIGRLRFDAEKAVLNAEPFVNIASLIDNEVYASTEGLKEENYRLQETLKKREEKCDQLQKELNRACEDIQKLKKFSLEERFACMRDWERSYDDLEISFPDNSIYGKMTFDGRTYSVYLANVTEYDKYHGGLTEDLKPERCRYTTKKFTLVQLNSDYEKQVLEKEFPGVEKWKTKIFNDGNYNCACELFKETT